MTRRRILFIVAGAAVLLGALAIIIGPYIYRDFVVGEAPTAPTVVKPATNPDAQITAATAEGTWTVSDGSYAGYRVDEVLRGVNVTVVGRTTDVSGTITIADSAVTSGKITVDAATIATSEPSRDSYFRSNVIESSDFPTATFELSNPTQIPNKTYEDKQGDQTVKGKLTLHGVTKEVTLTTQAGYDGTQVQIAGSIPANWNDYGIKAPSLGFAEVESNGFIEFLITLKK